MSGRSRSLATRVFFEAQFLGMEEVPHRTIIDLKATLGELGDEPAYGEVFPVDPPPRRSPSACGWCNTAGLAEQPNPRDHCADTDAKLRRRSASRHSTF